MITYYIEVYSYLMRIDDFIKIWSETFWNLHEI